MPVLEFNSENMPTPEEFRRLRREQAEVYEPLEELLQMERELAKLEQTYQISSEEFYRRYYTGEMGDDLVFVQWAGQYTLYLRLKKAIINSLKQVVATHVVLVP